MLVLLSDMISSLSLSPPALGANILCNVSHYTSNQLEEIGVGLNIALSWEEGLHNALMPVTPQASMGSLADSKGEEERQTKEERQTDRQRECVCVCGCNVLFV